MLSKSKKFIFIHAGKDGGTSIKKAMMSSNNPHGMKYVVGPHDSIQDYKITRYNLDKYFKFCFIRNPWDRLHSMYKWNIFSWNNTRNTWKKPGGRKYCLEQFKRFISQGSLDLTVLEKICDSDGVIQMDFIGRYCELQSDFNEVCSRMNVGPWNLPREKDLTSPDSETAKLLFQDREIVSDFREAYTLSHDRNSYDYDLIECVRKKYAREIEIFQWKFSDTETFKKCEPRRFNFKGVKV